eukprot:1129107-Prymnesium_polylepis.1
MAVRQSFRERRPPVVAEFDFVGDGVAAVAEFREMTRSARAVERERAAELFTVGERDAGARDGSVALLASSTPVVVGRRARAHVSYFMNDCEPDITKETRLLSQISQSHVASVPSPLSFFSRP